MRHIRIIIFYICVRYWNMIGDINHLWDNLIIEYFGFNPHHDIKRKIYTHTEEGMNSLHCIFKHQFYLYSCNLPKPQSVFRLHISVNPIETIHFIAYVAKRPPPCSITREKTSNRYILGYDTTCKISGPSKDTKRP